MKLEKVITERAHRTAEIVQRLKILVVDSIVDITGRRYAAPVIVATLTGHAMPGVTSRDLVHACNLAAETTRCADALNLIAEVKCLADRRVRR